MMNRSSEVFLKEIEGVFIQEKLQDTIHFSSLFVLFFESFKDDVIDHLLDIYREKEEYNKNVRRLDAKPLHASLQWFVRRGVITPSDFDRILEIELRRNDFVHELLKTVYEGIADSDKQLLQDLVSIYKKIDSWWVYNIEIDLDDIKDPENLKPEECFSSAMMMMNVIMDILLNGRGDVYRECYAQIKEAITRKDSII